MAATAPHPTRRHLVSRGWFAVTAFSAFSAVAIQVVVAAGARGHFTTPLEMALNVFAFFTIQSNIIVALTCLLLAVRLERTSELFRMFRLSGVVAILITGLVYHTMLAGLVDLHGWVAFTMIRGAAIHWYPYPFIDVDDLGYARVAANVVAVAAVFFGLAAAAYAYDRWALRRRQRARC